jgi:hypothetical protein
MQLFERQHSSPSYTKEPFMKPTLLKSLLPCILLSVAAPTLTRASIPGYVRPALPDEFPPGLTASTSYYPPFTSHPPIPDQSTITLTDTEPLALVLPGFSSPNIGKYFTFTLSQSQSSLSLTTYTLEGDTFLNTIFGPTDDVLSLGTLPAGDYSLQLTTFDAVDDGIQDFPAYIADPVSYTTSRGLQLGAGQSTFSFTVTPEPASLALLTPLLLLTRPRRGTSRPTE